LAGLGAAGADALVTGDRTHFGHPFGRTVGTLMVLTPADALDRLLA